MKTEQGLMIRKVKESDFEQWLILWNAYNHFYGRYALDFNVTKLTWERCNDVNEPVFALVAETGGVIIGMANFLYHTSTISIGPNCYLQDLYTSESARGRGVAMALINEVYRDAKNAGSSKVYWQTQHDNIEARRLYDKIAEASGFVVYRKFII